MRLSQVICRICIGCMCLLLITSCQNRTEKDANTVLVFAAASLRDVMQEIAHAYQQQTGQTVIFNFAGSNVLAQQIAASSKADVFLSANTQWINYLVDKNRIDTISKRQFLSNKLVFIAHKDNKFKLSSPEMLMDLPFRYLSVGDPQAVPAGRYAKAYLRTVNFNQKNLWQSLTNRILPASNVKSATAVVEAMPDIIGIVYKTDALASAKVRILYEPVTDERLSIQYVGARINKLEFQGSTNQAKGLPQYHPKAIDFLNYLSRTDSKLIFQKHGFITPPNRKTEIARGPIN